MMEVLFLLWARMAVYDYEYWLVMDLTVSRMAEMDGDPWLSTNACMQSNEL